MAVLCLFSPRPVRYPGLQYPVPVRHLAAAHWRHRRCQWRESPAARGVWHVVQDQKVRILWEKSFGSPAVNEPQKIEANLKVDVSVCRRRSFGYDWTTVSKNLAIKISLRKQKFNCYRFYSFKFTIISFGSWVKVGSSPPQSNKINLKFVPGCLGWEI